MPRIPRSEQTVGVAATPLPMHSGNADAVGRGIQQLGQGIGAALSGLMDEQTKADEFAAKLEESKFLYDQHKKLDDSIANNTGDGRGFHQSWEQGFDQDAKALADKYAANPKISREMQLRLANARHSYGMKALDGQQRLINQDTVVRTNKYSDQVASTVTDDLGSVDRALATVGAGIDQAPGITTTQRSHLKAYAGKMIMQQWIDKATRAGADPEALEKGMSVLEGRMKEWSAAREAEPAKQSNLLSGPLDEIDRTNSGLRDLGGIKPKGIVFHHTSGTTVDGAISTLKSRGLSYNYLIDRDGKVHTIVPPERGAQHMRPSEKNDLASNNTIGISFVARNDDDVTDKQRAAGRALAARDAARFGIDQNNVFGHGEVNSHKERGEGATDAAWIRNNGFNAGPMPTKVAPADAAPVPVGKRGIVDYAKGDNVAPVATGQPADGLDARTQGLPEDKTAPAPKAAGSDVLGQAATPGATTVPAPRPPGAADTVHDHFYHQLLTHQPQIQERIAKIRKMQDSAAWLNGMLRGEVPANPHSPDATKLYDEASKQAGMGESVFRGDARVIDNTLKLAANIKTIPADVYHAFQGMAEDPDPKRRALAYDSVNALVAKTPYAMNRHAGHDKLIADASEYASEVDLGRAPAVALANMANRRSPEFKAKEEARKKASHDFIKDEVSQSDLDANFSKGFFANLASLQRSPTSSDRFDSASQGVLADQAVILLEEYKDRARRYFIETGDKDLAKKQAGVDMQREWNVTNIDGGRQRIMRFPPERSYRAAGAPGKESHTYIMDQAVAEMRDYAKKNNMPWAKALEATVAIPETGGEAILNPKDNIELIGDEETKRDLAKGRPPSYAIKIRRVDMGNMPEIVIDMTTGKPKRWHPDPKLWEAQNEQPLKAAERENKAKLPKAAPSSVDSELVMPGVPQP